jgi:hypothetical protein
MEFTFITVIDICIFSEHYIPASGRGIRSRSSKESDFSTKAGPLLLLNDLTDFFLCFSFLLGKMLTVIIPIP